MKKCIFAISIAFATAVGVYCSYNKSTNNKATLSDIALANIEALSRGEGPNKGDRLRCYKDISSSGWGDPTFITYCGTCEPIYCKTYSNESGCYY